METHEPTPAPSGLQWNAGAWFGAQLGATCWMVIGAGLLFARDATVAALVLALFLVANLLCTTLWRRRARLAPLAGYSALVVIVVLAALAAVLAIHLTGNWDAVQVGGRVSPVAMYVLLAVLLPAMWLRLRAVDRQGRQRGGG